MLNFYFRPQSKSKNVTTPAKYHIPDNINLFQILNSIHRCHCLELIGLEEELIIDYFEEEYGLLYENASALENKVLVLHYNVPFDSDTDSFLHELCIHWIKYELQYIIDTNENDNSTN